MLQITIANNIRIRGSSVPLRADITRALTMPNPAYEKMKRMGKPTFGIDRQLQMFVWDADGTLVVPRGFEQELIKILEKHGLDPEKTITRQLHEFKDRTEFGPWSSSYTLRGYQEEAVAAATDSGCLIAPAGSGKTVMALKIVEKWGQPTLWITHTKDLLYQTAENARKYLGGVGEVGIIGDGKIVWGSGKLFVGMVQTLKGNPTLINTVQKLVGCIVVDEAHHFPATQFIELVGQLAPRYLLGITATPDRKDGLEKYMYYGIGPKFYEVKRDGLYDGGALMLPEVKFIFTDFAPQSGTEAANNVDAGGEDMNYTELIKELTSDEGRAKLIAEHVLESLLDANKDLKGKPGGSVIVLADTVRYLFVLRDLVERFSVSKLGADNVPRMAVIHGGLTQYTWRLTTKARAMRLEKTSPESVRYSTSLGRFQERFTQYTDRELEIWQVKPAQRKQAIEDARARKIDIIFATSALVKEGLDVPGLWAGHLATPQRGDTGKSATGSGIEQAIGRVQRPDPLNPDKKAVWYDYVDYNVGVFQQQYQSRRAVYRRLGIKLPVKKRVKTADQEALDFLLSGRIFDDLPL